MGAGIGAIVSLITVAAFMSSSPVGLRPGWRSGHDRREGIRRGSARRVSLLVVVVATFVLAGPVIGTMTAVLIALAIIVVLLVRIADGLRR